MVPPTAEASEWRRRFLAYAAFSGAGLMASFGLSWDIFWHEAVGRDRFLTPPHLLMYSGIALVGLISLYMVLSTTWLYRRQAPGVTAANTVPWLGAFRSPLGFVVAGLGSAALLLAAPGDNYWHLLYGIDLTLWSPFHMMGLLGGIINLLGAAYVAASLWNAYGGEAAAGRRVLGLTGLEWVCMLGLSAWINQVYVFSLPGYGEYTRLLGWALHPLLLALLVPIGMAAAVRWLARPAAAGALALIAAVFGVARDLFAHGGSTWLVASSGYAWRPLVPPVSRDVLGELVLVAGALAFALLAALFSRRGAPGRRALILAGAGAALLQALADRTLVAAIPAVLPLQASVLLWNVVALAVAGAIGAAFGDGLGRVLRITRY